MNKFLLVLIFLFAFVFLSCDLFYTGPFGRENPIDIEAQLGRFSAVQSGSNSVLVLWDWRDLWPGTDPDREIVEIVIADRKNGYPLSRLGGESFLKNSGSNLEFTNLDQDNEYYFGLYAKEKGGTWLAPLYAGTHLDNNGYIMSNGANIDNYLYAFDGANFSPTALTITNAQWVLIEFTLNGFNINAILNGTIDIALPVVAAVTGDVWIVPLRWRVPDGAPWDAVDNTFMLDMNNAVSFFMDNTNTNFVIDIKDVLNLTHLYGAYTIALIPNSSTGASFDLTGVNINYSYWETN